MALAQKGKAALFQKETEKALQLYKEALALAEKNQDYLAAAAVHNLMGELQEGAGRFQNALNHYERGMMALATKHAGDATDLVRTALAQLQSRGKDYRGNTGLPVSTDLYRGELADLGKFFAQSSPHAQTQISVLLMINAGNMYLKQSQPRQADSLYAQALRGSRQLRDRLQQQQIFANLAWSALSNYNYAAANVWLDSIAVDWRKAALPPDLLGAYHAYGASLSAQKNYAGAITNLARALKLYELAGDDRGRCRTLTDLAAAFFQQGEVATAQSHYRNALELNRTVQDSETSQAAHSGLAECYFQLGQFEQALRHYEAYWNAVVPLFNSFWTDEGRVSLLEHRGRIFENYVRAAAAWAVRQQQPDSARQVIERLRDRALQALQSPRGRTPEHAAGQLPARYALFERAAQRLRFAHGFAPDRVATPNMAMDINVVQRSIGVEDLPPPELNDTLRPPLLPPPMPDKNFPPIPEAEQLVPAPPATFLEYYLLSDRGLIFIKSPHGKTHMAEIAIGADSLAALITAYGYSLGVQASAWSRNLVPAGAAPKRVAAHKTEAEISRQLYQLLLAPVASLLPRDPAAVIVLVPHRSLWMLPFAALRDDKGQYFGDQHVLTFAASEASWRLQAQQPRSADHRKASAWIVGNPRMPKEAEACGSTFTAEPLAGAEQEAREIAGLFGPGRAQLFIGAQADALRLEAWHASFTVLHLATHGFVCEDALGSFLVLSELGENEIQLDTSAAKIFPASDARYAVALADFSQIGREYIPAPLSYSGILNARTIINRFNLRADLVTLSACQTGLGNFLGQGAIGFTRAFLVAGARSLLVSLWRVNDAATKDLMVTFYREYLQHGNKAVALQTAMQHTRRKYPQPKYWAAFTLVGMAE